MILKQKKAETYVDTAIIMVISVIVGALLLFGLKALMENIVIPKVTERIANLFVYADDSDDDPGGGGSAIVTPTTEKTIEKGIALPEGAKYVCYSDGSFYLEGQVIPTNYVPESGDTFTYGDYRYTRIDKNANCYAGVDEDALDGWCVDVLDQTKITYGEILSGIHGVKVCIADYTFAGCENMVKAPAIPSTIVSIEGAFSGCTSLLTAPDIPDGVVDIRSAFANCTSLVSLRYISGNIQCPGNAFVNCKNLTGTFSFAGENFVADSSDDLAAFEGTEKPITLKGRNGDTTGLWYLAGSNNWDCLVEGGNVHVEGLNP